MFFYSFHILLSLKMVRHLIIIGCIFLIVGLVRLVNVTRYVIFTMFSEHVFLNLKFNNNNNNLLFMKQHKF